MPISVKCSCDAKQCYIWYDRTRDMRLLSYAVILSSAITIGFRYPTPLQKTRVMLYLCMHA
ncbi:hypothetical protein BDV34DRAFT_200494 [Aspergillus parasiticus]|uniref:Uncharacterized protein n=1 Tax=Aspergillus parasiticus TaxID=5067 RepID=A0A5N6DBX0_ASPPA|nr:hypothetical protein BDV34DRAFT_200494 [Aspergillus parasiticus]